jgi:acyl-CoA thioester hydrolase
MSAHNKAITDIISTTEIKVRYAETDKMGVVYYANYLIWLEVARTDYLAALGIHYADLERLGFFLPVLEAHCKYIRSAKYGDTVTIATRISDIDSRGLRFEYKLSTPQTSILSKGYTRHVFVDKDMKPNGSPRH